MPHLFIFLLKVNLALLVFCAGYYLVLKRLTFYTLNRIYLIAAILFASVYPKLNLSAFLQQHQRIAEPVQAIAFTIQTPPRDLIKPIYHHHGYWRYAETIFWAGVILFALRLLVQFVSLYRIYKSSNKGRLHGYDVRLINGDGGPFSFWKSIYVNPDKHAPGDLKAILQHEQIHVSEWHTADILLSELSTIFYWFNPGVWLIKKAIRENIEFITDRKILQNGTDCKQYQYSLVNVSFAAAPQGIVNHFNISTIKKRIIMMNTKRSSKMNLGRYILLVPAVIALLLVFSVSRAALAKKHPIANSVQQWVSPKTKALNVKLKLVTTLTRAADHAVTTVSQTSRDTNKGVKAKVKSDTTRKIHIPQKNGEVTIDQPDVIVVDGQIVKDYDLSKINTDEVSSIDITKQDGKNTVYVQTKNGVREHNRIINVEGSGRLNYKGTMINVNGGMVLIDSLKTPDGRVKFDTVYVTGSLHNMQWTHGVNIAAKVPAKTYTYDKKSVRYAPKPFTTVYSTTVKSDGEVSLSDLSSKLVIINGNVATKADLKKLSAFDIDRMVLKTDDETKELYGDRAKNGVVFIVTKKK